MKIKQARESTWSSQNISLHRALVSCRTIYAGKNSSFSDSVFHCAAVTLSDYYEYGNECHGSIKFGKILLFIIKETFCVFLNQKT